MAKSAEPKESPREPNGLQPPPRRGEGFLDRFTEKLGRTANSHTIFGEAVEAEGVVVIPVASVYMGLDARRETVDGDETEVAGKSDVKVYPVGYIEIRDGLSEFRPIESSSTKPLMLMGAAILVPLCFLALKSIYRD